LALYVLNIVARALCVAENISANNECQNGDATTYLVTCPKTVAAAACGILGTGMTAMAAPTTMSLVNADSNGK